jgi:lipopolysaccharide assembly outer membrane protein LptD (OstA)
MQTENNIRRLQGDVRIETAAISLRANEATYNPKTHEINARGDVRVTLK